LVKCNGDCVNLNEDPNNCGSCGNKVSACFFYVRSSMALGSWFFAVMSQTL